MCILTMSDINIYYLMMCAEQIIWWII